MLWCAFGFLLCVAATALDYQFLKKRPGRCSSSRWCCLSWCAAVATWHHQKINGAHRWFILPGVRLQPSELGKIALIVMLACMATAFNGR